MMLLARTAQLVAAVSHWRHDWEHLQALKIKHAAQSTLQEEVNKLKVEVRSDRAARSRSRVRH